MTLNDFTKKRARIEREYTKGSKRAAAMRHLVREAGASVVVVGNRVTGWRLKTGEMVCVKRRHGDEEHAAAELARTHSTNWDGHKVPTRVYACLHCKGWHLTSQPAQFDQAA